MIRRVLALVLFAAALLPLRTRAQTITVAPGGEMSSLVNMPFDVPIYVDMSQRTEKLGSFAASVRWNPAVLHFDSGNDGTFGSVTVNLDTVAGVVRVAGANPGGVGGLITLGVLRFTPLVAQQDTLHFSVTELYAAGTFAALTPVSTRDGYFCPARGMFGDVDKDGAINSRDALIALSNAVGLDVSAFDITLGDVDANGATNARDALIILSSAVGLPVTGFQVGRLAGGACASNLPLVMTVVPDVVDLVVGQTVAFEARAKDSTGALQTVTNAIWKSGNSAALAVFGDGTALARDTGTVRVTAIRTALDSAQAVVHIVAHRGLQIVDAAAANARNQLGSAAFPFAQINQGVAASRDGDTVEVRVGRYAETVELDRGAVLMGDTLADGTRPLVAGGTGTSYVGILLSGNGARVVRDLAIDGFGVGVDLAGPTRAFLHGLRGTHLSWGVVVDAPMAFARLEASRLTGNGMNSSEGDGVLTDAYVDTLVVYGTEISDFGLDGIIAGGTDSLVVLQSQVHDVGYYGIQAGPEPGGCLECLGVPVARAPRAGVVGPLMPAVVVDSSAVVRAGYRVAYLEDTRSAVFAHSRLGGGEYGVEVYGSGSGWLRFVGDSIQGYGGYSYNWLDVRSLDSLRVDSTYVSSQHGNANNVNLIRVTNTQFANAQDNPLSVSFGESRAGGQVFLDNVTIAGDPHCDLCGDGFDFGPSAVVANRLTAVNLSRGIVAHNDSSLTITHSLFQHVQSPIDWEVSSSDTLSRLTVTNTTFSGFGDGINANTGAVVVDSNTFQNGGGTAVAVDNQGLARITRNRVSGGLGTAFEVYGHSATTNRALVDTIADNVVTDLTNNYGIYADGADTASFQILRNTVACSGAGATNATGIDLEYANGVLGGNLVSGCYSGIYVYDDGGPPRVDSIRGNTLSIPAGASQGISVEGSIKSGIANNMVTGDTAGSLYYGSISVYGYSGATATIDSNVVVGARLKGIYAGELDSALVRYNTVQSVVGDGILADRYFTYLVRLHGNTVRHIHGNGLRILNSDTAMVLVDSNLVSGSDSAGVRMDGGADSIVRNRITGSGVVGILASYSVDWARTLVDSNNIVGNRFGIQVPIEATIQAPNNWWGDAKGPRCTNTNACDQTSLGDSVSSSGVAFNPVAAEEFGTTPSPSVRALPVVALRAPAISGGRRVAATGLDAPLPLKPRAERRVQEAAPPAPRALTSVRVPPGLGAARAQAWQLMLQHRAAALAARVQRDGAAAQARAARITADAARERQLEQRKAAHEAARQAGLVKRAAKAVRPGRGVRQ